MKKILILGGTGAMGVPLVRLLSEQQKVYVTSRSARESTERVEYLRGNARDAAFLERVLKLEDWDAVVDFMVHGQSVFPDVMRLILEHTRQYVFISSARVYARSDRPITEETPRLLDVSDDAAYLRTGEYALAKAREEDVLRNSGRANWTIVRPSITYNDHRLQLGVLEKENWLYRALHGRTIVFSEDVNDKITTMTHGDDVAQGIASVVGKEEALGEVFHITSPDSLPWSAVLDVYMGVLLRRLPEGHLPKVMLTHKSTNLLFKDRKYQLVYCRYFNRSFDNGKIGRFCDVSRFVPPREGLAKCLEAFLDHPHFDPIDWRLEAVNDRVAGERTPSDEIPGWSSKSWYWLYRYGPRPLIPLVAAAFGMLGWLKHKLKP